MSLKKTIKEFKNHLGDKESILDSNYARIAEKIELHWGYKEFYLYINKLLVVEKERSRAGFPIDALKEIYVLQEIHDKLFPGIKEQAMNEIVQNPYTDQTKFTAIISH